MRGIKFRGYCERDSEWRHGFYITDGKAHEINTMLKSGEFYASQVDADSVGQYTGLKDKNGVEIYEGDVVHFDGYNLQCIIETDGVWFENDKLTMRYDDFEKCGADLTVSMSTWYCAAYFNGEEFDMTVQCERLAEAEHAFEQHLWMEYELTKDVVKGWVIVDTEFMPCND